MGIEVTVQDEDLGELEARLSGLTLQQVTELGAPEIRELVRAEFYAGADPFDQTWTPLATGAAAHLIESSSMVDAVQVAGVADGFEYSDDCKLFFHQTGSGHVPARPVLPLDGEIPDTWDRVLADAVAELLGGQP